MELHERIIRAYEKSHYLRAVKNRSFCARSHTKGTIALPIVVLGTNERRDRCAAELEKILEKYNQEYINQLETEVAQLFADIQQDG